MASTRATHQTGAQNKRGTKSRLMRSIVGPGLLVAATGVGAGDLVTSLSSGAEYGLTFVWAIVIGATLKFGLTESIGRWSLATGIMPLRGLHSMSPWITGYFGAYAVVLGFFYGAAILSACGLALNAMIPQLSIDAWAMISGVVGLGLLLIGRYHVFERVMQFFVALMFVSTIGAAIMTRPDLGDLAVGFRPTVPDGSLLYLLGVVGGVGMTLSLCSYGYWLRDRGWKGQQQISAMRIDLVVGYTLTFAFMVSMMIVGTEFLYGTGRTIDGEEGLLALAEPFGAEFGSAAKWLLLLGFFSAVFSSLIGGFNSMAYVFSDVVNVSRGLPQEDDDRAERTWTFRGYLVWSTFPPMVLLFVGSPVFLVLTYTAISALFVPVMAASLLWLMNSKRMPIPHRNRWIANINLAASVVLFGALAVHELMNL